MNYLAAEPRGIQFQLPGFYSRPVREHAILFKMLFFFCFCLGKSSKTTGGHELAFAPALLLPEESIFTTTPLRYAWHATGEPHARQYFFWRLWWDPAQLHATHRLAQT